MDNSKQLPTLRKAFMDLTNETANLEAEKYSLTSEVSNLKNELEKYEGYLYLYEVEAREKKRRHTVS